ncbi:hypothetical protein HO173_011031 [Letharia columbiana]|uniref:Uncharacterized protein n=1 Tax=Letharia columbiana TaxID=112416 RepID=A0A8H6FLD2_9LECA|nr:uncharacterized protein HO173_011031 [Letharia columbiana]KAF6230679.1 hypothetical protein HO173_011031 [Letharia columbiana]
MNTIVLGTPRPKVTQRLRHIHPFCPPLRAPTDAPRPPLGESATAGNRGRKRAQQLPTTGHKRAERLFKRARTDTSSPTDSSQASGGAFQPSDATSQDASSSPIRSSSPYFKASQRVLDPKHRQEEAPKREEDTIEDPLLRDLPPDFFNNDSFDSPRPSNPPSSPYLGPTQPPARLASYTARHPYTTEPTRHNLSPINQICDSYGAAS